MKQLLFVVCCILCQCTPSARISSELAPEADFSQYKTFDFYQLDASGDTLSTKFSSRTRSMEYAIEQEMKAKGYTRTNTNPDLLINIGIVVEEKKQTRQTDFRTDAPRYIGQRNYSWKSEEVTVGTYREGTVTVDLVDRATNKRVWEGVAREIIPNRDDRVEKAIGTGVKLLLKDVPAK
ncbi:MAG: DUF4136 domain-containing protein [Chitinophagaceae bacterium]